MLLFSRGSWRDHRPWCIFTVALAVLALVWFIASGLGQSDWPSGSSLPGFTFGVVGGLIILFEFFLWIRKRWLRVWRIGRTQKWMRAHIWLGLLCGPILLLHSGLRWGGTLSTVLSIILIVVLLSGIWGLILQNKLPRLMLTEVPAETIYSQMDALANKMADDANMLVRAVCGSAVDEPGQTPEDVEEETGHLVVGAVRVVGRVAGKVLGTQAPLTPVADSESLRVFFEGQVDPYLRQGKASGSQLAIQSSSDRMFDDLRTKLPGEAHHAVASLQGYVDQRRQWDYQAGLHLLLHSWLVVHFALSVALIVLMVLHVFVALKYW